MAVAAPAGFGRDATWRIVGTEERSEVAKRAWAYVHASATDYHPSELLGNLLAVNPSDMDYLRALVQMRNAATIRFLQAVPQILERLAQTVEVDIEELLVPIGRVDWPSTVLGAVTKGHLASFIVRRSDPHRDLPENRLLRYLLNRLRDLSSLLTRGRTEGELSQGWLGDIDEMGKVAEGFAEHPLLQTVVPVASHAGLSACRNSRIPGYAYLADAYEVELRVGPEPTEHGIQELLATGVLIPQLEWRAYELLVLFRVLSELDASGFKAERTRLIGLGSGHVFKLRRGTDTIDLYYQQSPFKSLRYGTTLVGAGFDRAALRPDIVLIKRGLTASEVTLFEMKCSTDTSQVGEAIVQLFGYRYDLAGLPEGHLTSLVAVTPVGRPSTPSQWPEAAYGGDFQAWTTDHVHLAALVAKLASEPS